MIEVEVFETKVLADGREITTGPGTTYEFEDLRAAKRVLHKLLSPTPKYRSMPTALHGFEFDSVWHGGRALYMKKNKPYGVWDLFPDMARPQGQTSVRLVDDIYRHELGTGENRLKTNGT